MFVFVYTWGNESDFSAWDDRAVADDKLLVVGRGVFYARLSSSHHGLKLISGAEG